MSFDIGDRMPSADEYRAKATELLAKAKCETDLNLRIELESLALAYTRLAEQAERNSRTDIVYETPPLQPKSEE